MVSIGKWFLLVRGCLMCGLNEYDHAPFNFLHPSPPPPHSLIMEGGGRIKKKFFLFGLFSHIIKPGSFQHNVFQLHYTSLLEFHVMIYNAQHKKVVFGMCERGCVCVDSSHYDMLVVFPVSCKISLI